MIVDYLPVNALPSCAGTGAPLESGGLAPSSEGTGSADTTQLCVADYLRERIFPILASPPFGEMVINRLSCQRPVFVFTEVHRNITVVGKLFKDDSVPLDQAWRRAEREYHQLNLMQKRYGMRSGLDRVVTPYGKNRDFSALLVMQLAPGRMLDHYISEAAHNGGHDHLMKRLGYLARFFSKLHRGSQTGTPVSPMLAHQYFNKIICGLANGPLCGREKDNLERYASLWWNRPSLLTADEEVVVHGDATPTNFLIHHEEVTGIDVERMCQADRCWDLGFMAAELKHHFMWRRGDPWAAEPFIRHFLECYSSILGKDRMFEGIAERLPLYMALGLLRIARNMWLDDRYRTSLLREARRCLKYGLLSSTTTEP